MDSEEEIIDEKHIEGSIKIEKLEEARFPLDKLARIVHKNKDGREISFGTGFQIFGYLVLTCVHNLVKSAQQSRPVNPHELIVYIGQNGSATQQMTYEVADIKWNYQYFDPSKIGKEKKKYDYAILLLKPNKANALDPKSSIKLSIPKKQKDYKFELYGYDAELNQIYKKLKEFYLWGCMSDIYKMDQFFIYYKFSTQGGKSGAPLITYSKQGVFNIIGIHLGASNKDYNFALRINQDVFNTIKRWLQEWQQGEQAINPLESAFHHHKTEKPQVPQTPQRASLQKNILIIGFDSIISTFMNIFSYQVNQKQTPTKKEKHVINEKAQIQEKVKIQENSKKKYPPPRIQKNISSYDSRTSQKIIIAPPNFQSQLSANQREISRNKIKTIQTQADLKSSINYQIYSKQSKQFRCEDMKFKFELVPKYLNNVIKLTLNQCKLTVIPCLGKLQRLRQIECQHNSIDKMDNLLTFVVEKLNLKWNNITEIPQKIGQALKLKELLLSYNEKLKVISRKIIDIIEINLLTLEIRKYILTKGGTPSLIGNQFLNDLKDLKDQKEWEIDIIQDE